MRKVGIYLLATIMLLMSCVFVIDTNVYAVDQRTGTINATNVNVRSGPGTSYGRVGKVTKGDYGIIIGEEKDDSGSIWYQMTIDEIEGWVISTYVDVKVESLDFKEYLTLAGFPETYHAGLIALHEKYPNWVFEAQQTGLTWNEVITAESKLGRNLIHKSSISSWKSIQTGAYDWETSTWVPFDGGAWVAASEDIIKYYMDPRNFFDEKYVFQFLRQSYDANMDYTTSITAMFSKSTFWSGSFEEGGKTKNYVEAVLEAGKVSGVSPYTIASTIIQEQGWNPTSALVSGASGYYNFFNAGAYEADGMGPVERGIWYAKQIDAATLRPWNTRTKSLAGGALIYGKNYVSVGQDTIYLKKFDVVDDGGLYNHQYMTNIQAAASEGKLLSDAFWSESAKESTATSSLAFKIPVYKDMPNDVCVKPTGDGSPNYMLKSLSVSGQSLTPTFSMYETEYSVIVPNEVGSVTVSASAYDSSAKVLGTGDVSLNVGTNKVDVRVKASNGNVRTYTISIIREKAEDIYVPPVLESNTYTLNNDVKTITGITNFPITKDEFVKAFNVKNGEIKCTKADGTELNGNVGTGTKVTVYDTAGTLKASYSVIIYGDTNGDGNVNALDLLRVQKNILGLSSLKDLYYKAGDTSKNGTIDALDLLQVQKQILGIKAIKQ